MAHEFGDIYFYQTYELLLLCRCYCPWYSATIYKIIDVQICIWPLVSHLPYTTSYFTNVVYLNNIPAYPYMQNTDHTCLLLHDDDDVNEKFYTSCCEVYP